MWQQRVFLTFGLARARVSASSPDLPPPSSSHSFILQILQMPLCSVTFHPQQQLFFLFARLTKTAHLHSERAGHAGEIKKPALGHSSPDPRVVRGSVYIISARLAGVQNPRREYEPRFEKMRATQERLRALPDSFVRGFRAGLNQSSPCKSTPLQWI